MSKNKAFTIIELIVVIAIISVLASIITANVMQMREKAKIAKAKSEVTAIYKAILMKFADDGLYPYTDGNSNITTAADFNVKLAPYITSIGLDPWNNYFFDGCPEPCSSCPIQPINCDGQGLYRTSVRSAGPGGQYGSFNVAPPDGDDIIIFLSRKD